MIRNSLAVAWKDLLIVLKDKGALAVYFLMPLAFAAMLGMAFGNAGNEETTIEIAALLVNRDGGTYGAMLAEGLSDVDVLVLEEVVSAVEADETVASGEVAAALVIPEDFSARIDAGEPAQVTLIKDPTKQDEAAIVAGIANQAMTEIGLVGELRYGIRTVLSENPEWEEAGPEMQQAVEAQTLGVMWTQVQAMRQNPVIAVRDEAVAGAEEMQPWDPITYYVPSFTVAFAFFLVGQMANTLLLEKEEGTFRRLMAAPMERGAIVVGKMLAYMGIVVLQVLVLFGVGRVVFDMSLGESPVALVLLTAGLATASAALGMLVGALSKTSEQADSVGTVLGFVLLALGGSIFPLFRAEGFIGIVSRLTPSAWGIEGFMGLVADGWTLVDALPNIAALFGFAVVFGAVAIWRFRFSE